MKRSRIKSEPNTRLPARTERTLLQAELPAASGLPLLRFRLEMTTEPQGAGERLRLRAHVHSSLGNAAAAVAAPSRLRLGADSIAGLPARRTAPLFASGDPLKRLGVELPPGDGPLAQTWAGETGGERAGHAQFSLLRFDQRHLPPALASLLGSRPFQLVAAVASVIERHIPEPSSK